MKTTLALSATAILLTFSANAQTGAELVLLPWQENQSAQVSGDASYQSTETDRANFDIDLTRLDSAGRFRLNPSSDDSPVVGYDYTYLNLHTSDPMLPSRLVDFSLAFGGQLGTTDFGLDYGDWRVGYTLGVGYAGDVPFHDGDAWYALASLSAIRIIDQDTQWIIAIDYDGNRSFLPDLPIPSVMYRARYNDELTYALGLPFSSLTWTPDENWTVLLNTALFISITARVEYQASAALVFFGAYERGVDAFQLDGDNNNRRLIFSQERIELGVQYALDDNTTLTAACGYAFNQEFERGFDTRDTTTVRDLDDALYFRLGVAFGF